MPISDVLMAGPMAAFGTPASWHLFAQAQAEKRDWYYGDHGVFRRFRYFRITKNALQPDCLSGRADERRWMALHVDRAPAWQPSGRDVIICPQSPVYMQYYFGHQYAEVNPDPTEFYSRLVRPFTDRPLIVRWKKDATDRPLRVDLQNAHMVITWSSAAAVDALAAGVPVCTLAPWASTFPMGVQSLDRIESPIRPSIDQRDQFLFNLAAAQWTMNEIEAGLAWRALQA